MSRTLIDGKVVPDLDSAQRITISSRCPAKWIFIDTETGDVWEQQDSHFTRASEESLGRAVTCCGLAKIRLKELADAERAYRDGRELPDQDRGN